MNVLRASQIKWKQQDSEFKHFPVKVPFVLINDQRLFVTGKSITYSLYGEELNGKVSKKHFAVIVIEVTPYFYEEVLVLNKSGEIEI